MGQTATLKKISTQLNLSISTVSRALNNHPDISELTKQKVRDLAALMEYEPNSYAVNLRTNKSSVFGIVVPAISNMFYDSFISAVEEEARKKNYSLLILQSGDDPLQEMENLRICKHNRVDGIFISIVPDTHSTEIITKYRDSGIPVLFFDRVPEYQGFDTVCMADDEAATNAANTIIEHKKKKVLALFGNPELSITKKRKLAFTRTMANAKKINCTSYYCLNANEATKLVLDQVKSSSKPDHIFCMSDELLIGTMKALHQTELKIPEEVSVLAISNGFIPGLFKPEITYIETSGYALGKMAIKRMLENMKEVQPAASFILPARLMPGGSL